MSSPIVGPPFADCTWAKPGPDDDNDDDFDDDDGDDDDEDDDA